MFCTSSGSIYFHGHDKLPSACIMRREWGSINQFGHTITYGEQEGPNVLCKILDVYIQIYVSKTQMHGTHVLMRTAKVGMHCRYLCLLNALIWGYSSE